jgi:hypothetical protein
METIPQESTSQPQIHPSGAGADNTLPYRNWWVRLRPGWETNYIGQGRTVLATGQNGFIASVPEHGFFVNETRLLSQCEYRIDGESVRPVAISNVEQHTWLAYYILLPPGFGKEFRDEGSGHVSASSQNSLELRLSRYVSGGVHQDIDLINFTQRPTSFHLQWHIDADFAGIDEALGRLQQRGRRTRRWNATGTAQGTLPQLRSAPQIQ